MNDCKFIAGAVRSGVDGHCLKRRDPLLKVSSTGLRSDLVVEHIEAHSKALREFWQCRVSSGVGGLGPGSGNIVVPVAVISPYDDEIPGTYLHVGYGFAV